MAGTALRLSELSGLASRPVYFLPPFPRDALRFRFGLTLAVIAFESFEPSFRAR
jgi:hypothetical protein